MNAYDEILDKEKWNHNYLAATFDENPHFLSKNGTKRPLSTILNETYPHYINRTAYFKSLIFPQKINIDKCYENLADISCVIDRLNLLSDTEEEFYQDKCSFFNTNYGNVFELSDDVEREYEDVLDAIRTYAFLRGDVSVSELEIKFEEIQKNLDKNRILNKSTDLIGLGTTMSLMSNLSFSPYYGNEIGALTSGLFLGIGFSNFAHKVYQFEIDNNYVSLAIKCGKTDRLIRKLYNSK